MKIKLWSNNITQRKLFTIQYIVCSVFAFPIFIIRTFNKKNKKIIKNMHKKGSDHCQLSTILMYVYYLHFV